jgi:hypothetical protein
MIYRGRCHTTLLVLMWPISAATPRIDPSELAYSLQTQLKRTGSQADIVERQLGDPWVELQEKRQRLANTSSGTENGNLGRLHHMQSAYAYSGYFPIALYCHADAPTTKAIGTREITNLAGRRRKGAARGLGESLSSSEHYDCNWDEDTIWNRWWGWRREAAGRGFARVTSAAAAVKH